MSAGDLTEEDVEGIRSGRTPDPTARQIAALAGAFGVPPSYLLDRGEPPLDEELLRALRDDTLRAITQRGPAAARAREDDGPGHRSAVCGGERPRERGAMTSGYIPPKGEPGPDEILEAVRAALEENPWLAEAPEEEVARQLVLGGRLEDEPSPPLVAEALQSLEAEEGKPLAGTEQ